MNNFDSLTTEQRLRASLHRSARAASVEVCARLGLQCSPTAADLLAELLYRKLGTYGADLEAFAKHAKRNTINAEDVKLLARRNPSLKAHVTSLSEATPSKDKRRKTAAPAAPSAPASVSALAPAPAPSPDKTPAPIPGAAGRQPSTSAEAMDFDIDTTIDLTL